MPRQFDNRLKAKSLIIEMRSGGASDERQEIIFRKLDEILPDPNYWDYLIDHDPELSPDEVIERAFNYKPIIR